MSQIVPTPATPEERRRRAPGSPLAFFPALVLLVLSLVSALPAAATGQENAPYPSSVSQWRARRQANGAFSQGQLKEAAPIYRGLLASMSKTDEHRAEVLYKLAIIHLAAKPPLHDSSAALAELNELAKSFPHSDYQAEASVILATLAQVADQREKVAGLESHNRSLEVEIAKVKQKSASELQSRRVGAEQTERQLRGEIGALKRKLSALQDQLKKEQADLAKARAALRKVSETLVGGKKGGN